tara:strand:- start:389 stop:868 length:480 start_codon:yes stop_codon:yes gene_type:complete
MLFQMHLSGAAKPAFAIVAAHGLTDLDSSAWVTPYLTLALLPMPTEAVTALFCASSVFHFSEDSSPLLSAGLHTLVLVAGLFFGVQTAFMTMLGYLALLHVPAHYTRCAFRGRGHAAKWALVVGGAAALGSVFLPEVDVSFGDELQRLVIAHVVVEKDK